MSLSLPTGMLWGSPQAAEAFELLARHQRLGNAGGRSGEPAPAPEDIAPDDGSSSASQNRLEDRARAFALEVHWRELTYGDLEHPAGSLSGTLLEIPGDGDLPPSYLPVVGGNSRWVQVLSPDGEAQRLPTADLRRELRRPVEVDLTQQIDRMLDATDLDGRARRRARRGLLLERLAERPCGRVLRILPSPGSDFLAQARSAGLAKRLGGLAAAHGGQVLLLLLGWWLLGRGALDGSLEGGWLWAWGLLLLTALPLQGIAFWNQGVLALGLGALLRRRLLRGALSLDLEEPRRDGAGQLFGRVLEAETVERLALNGGFRSVFFVFEWGLAAWVLSLGLGASMLVPLLLLWTASTLMLAYGYYRSRRRWTASRVTMTDSMVEGMVGHATRLAQQQRQSWHRQEDRDLADYLRDSRRLDGRLLVLASLAARGWLLISLAALIIPLQQTVDGAPDLAPLAISLGGILLAQRALSRLVDGGIDLAGAAVSWQQVRHLFARGRRLDAPGDTSIREAAAKALSPISTRVSSGQPDVSAPRPVLAARQLGFGYPGRPAPVLDALQLTVYPRDQVLLEGDSGAGKSTLIALLGALRSPDRGLLLLHGVDPHGWGSAAWRRRVAIAPQFHENHLFSGPLAFNLLLGREWPPTPQALASAEATCRELGLGPLLERMPGGILQTVGETGWKLSHGERSRVFIARALLQDADVVVLDESFAAMDPENLSHCLAAVRRMAPTLLVIAHP